MSLRLLSCAIGAERIVLNWNERHVSEIRLVIDRHQGKIRRAMPRRIGVTSRSVDIIPAFQKSSDDTILSCVKLGDSSMVRKVAEDGGVWHEPPYTEEEEEEFYRRFGQGVIQVMHGSRTIVPQPPRLPTNDPLNDPPESQTPTPAR